jgi:hypothetical protein
LSKNSHNELLLNVPDEVRRNLNLFSAGNVS